MNKIPFFLLALFHLLGLTHKPSSRLYGLRPFTWFCLVMMAFAGVMMIAPEILNSFLEAIREVMQQ